METRRPEERQAFGNLQGQGLNSIVQAARAKALTTPMETAKTAICSPPGLNAEAREPSSARHSPIVWSARPIAKRPTWRGPIKGQREGEETGVKRGGSVVFGYPLATRQNKNVW